MTRKSITGKSRTARRARAPTRPSRAKRPDAIDTLVAANAQALALPIDPAWRPAIAFNLQLLFKHAKIVEAFSLPDDTDPAPVFRA
ncbi:MAG: DUF4089 domain-containing protein [Xanthobacteraceae bacterium]|jgi:hypothetical protein